MREARGDMFNKHPRSAIVISTNGYVNVKGQAVMGRGCAKQAADKYPELSYLLGKKLNEQGNHVHLFYLGGQADALVSFPVKPAYVLYEQDSDVVRHWREKSVKGKKVMGFAARAQLPLIVQSAHELVALTNEHGWEDVVCPQFGCGAGELNWEDIKTVLEPILDDRFICMSFG